MPRSRARQLEKSADYFRSQRRMRREAHRALVQTMAADGVPDSIVALADTGMQAYRSRRFSAPKTGRTHSPPVTLWKEQIMGTVSNTGKRVDDNGDGANGWQRSDRGGLEHAYGKPETGSLSYDFEGRIAKTAGIPLGNRSYEDAAAEDMSEFKADEDALPLAVRAVFEYDGSIVNSVMSDEEMEKEFLNRRLVEHLHTTEPEENLRAVEAQMQMWKEVPSGVAYEVNAEDSTGGSYLRNQTESEIFLSMLALTRREVKMDAAAERSFKRWEADENRIPFQRIDAEGGLHSMSGEEVRQMLHTVERMEVVKKAVFYQRPKEMVWDGNMPIDVSATAAKSRPGQSEVEAKPGFERTNAGWVRSVETWTKIVRPRK